MLASLKHVLSRNCQLCTCADRYNRNVDPSKNTFSGKEFFNFKLREVGGYVNGTTGFGNMWFVLKMSEPVAHVSTGAKKSNGVTRPRYPSRCFAPSCKISKKALAISQNFKTLMHCGFLVKFNVWEHVRKSIKIGHLRGRGWNFAFVSCSFFTLKNAEIRVQWICFVSDRI